MAEWLAWLAASGLNWVIWLCIPLIVIGLGALLLRKSALWGVIVIMVGLGLGYQYLFWGVIWLLGALGITYFLKSRWRALPKAKA
jgi:hypothetical protein